jgi:hypothetical protein
LRERSRAVRFAERFSNRFRGIAGRLRRLRERSEAPSMTSDGPSVVYALAVLIAACLLAVAAAGPGDYLLQVQTFPDMSSYAEAATAVRHWHMAGVVARQFWGYAYAGAALSLFLPGVPILVVLLIISALSGCVAVALAHRLWGGWIAVYMTALGWPWIQRVAFGGSEPLFMALVLGTFLAIRHDSYRRAALCAALATVVRPIGVFALAAVLATAIWRRRPSEAGLGVAIAGAVFAAYCAPLVVGTGDPLANVHWYLPQMTNGNPTGIPFVALWRGTRTNQVSPLREILFVGAIAIVVMAPFSARGRDHAYRAENLFALGTSCFLITLNCPPCAWAFPRFAIVSLPFALIVVRRYLPHDDRVLALAAMVSALLAAAMQVDDRAPGTVLFHLFGHLL